MVGLTRCRLGVHLKQRLQIMPNSPFKGRQALWAGFEPARGNPIGFQVQRLNHSAITACFKCFVTSLQTEFVLEVSLITVITCNATIVQLNQPVAMWSSHWTYWALTSAQCKVVRSTSVTAIFWPTQCTCAHLCTHGSLDLKMRCG